MTKIDVFSGFLGAGKTTLIKKLITEAYKGEKLVLIENEFGQIGIDGAFMQDAGIEITEMNSGCICCSLVGDFGDALKKVLSQFAPDRILIEPSGVGKLSDVVGAIGTVLSDDVVLGVCATVVDASKCKMYMKNFGEFFGDQIKSATSVILSHTQTTGQDKLKAAMEIIRENNKDAVCITTDWDKIDGSEILSAMENATTLEKELDKLKDEAACPVCGHHHEHHHDEECTCGHHHEHHHDEECTCGHHHEHHHDEECTCGHHHEHHHDEECTCGHHHDHHHDHHHADDVFGSWGLETARAYTKEDIKTALSQLGNSEAYGTVLRAKGVVEGENGEWIHFDYVPDEPDVRDGAPSVIGRICVIGSGLKEENLSKLFDR